MAGRMQGPALLAAAALLAGCGETGIGSVGEAFGLGGDDPPVAADGTAEAVPAAPVPAVGGQRSWSGPQSAAAVDLRMVAEDERAWGILWQLVGEPAPGPLPDGAMALAVFVGVRPTGGYAVDILDVARTDGAVAVTYRETMPAPDAVVTQALSAPYRILLVQPSDDPVVFRPASG